MRTTQVLAILTSGALAQYNLYSDWTVDQLTGIHNITSGCAIALNTTINCDEPTMAMAAQGPDKNYWYTNNLTTLCDSTCSSSLASWLSTVQDDCGDQTLSWMDTSIYADGLPIIHQEAFNLVCLQDANENWCFYESQSWQGSNFIQYSPDMCLGNPNATDYPTLCMNDTFSTTDMTPEMMNVTNLYNQSLLCNDCFVRMWRQRLLDPFIQDMDFTEYLIDSYQDIQQNCSTSLPVATSTGILWAEPTGLNASASVSASPTAPTSQPTGNVTCIGQTIEAPENGSTFCQTLSDQYNVTTGELVYVTDDIVSCSFNGSICVSLPCEGETIWDGQTCDDLASNYSTSDLNVTLPMFLSWNPYILGDCARPIQGQRVCSRPPGGLGTPTGVISAPTALGQYTTTATASEPTQSGTTADCGLYYNVVSGDTCSSINVRFELNSTQLWQLNPELYTNCTNLWLGYAVCVAPVTPSNTTSTPTTSLSTTTTSPTGSVSTNGLCGPSNGYMTCPGSNFGDCCSTSGYCGNSSDYCGPGNCYSGQCDPDTGGPSTDGSCGPNFAGNKTCTGTQFGNCCSINGYCGNSSAYCGNGNCYSGQCQTTGQAISPNGLCGPSQTGNYTCTGSDFGVCCSTGGYCGNSTAYCGQGNCYSGECDT